MKLDPNAVNDTDFPVLPEGEYEFEVENTTYQTSKAGNYQWKVQLRIDPTGGQPSVKVWDYFPEMENMMWKFNNFFKALGYDGIDDTDKMKEVIGDIGFCKLKIEPAQNGYPEKNKVDRYVESPTPASKTLETKKAASKGLDISSDDLPF